MLRFFLTGTLLVASVTPLLCQQKIPNLRGTTLSGTTVDFPHDLQGHTSVLIVSFSQSAKDTVTMWFTRLADDYRGSPHVLYYALPDLSGAPGFLRGTIARKIKDSVAEPARSRFVAIMNHDEPWKAATSFSKQTPDDQAWVLLVDGTGTVRAHFATAAPTDQSYANFKRQLEQLR